MKWNRNIITANSINISNEFNVNLQSKIYWNNNEIWRESSDVSK